VEEKYLIICLEAIDGAGKSSQVELLKQYFQSQNKLVVRTLHFPDKSSLWGKEIYKWLENKTNYPKEVFELLQTIDKTNKIEYIEQFKNNDDWVLIIDRYNLSQYSYALASRIDREWTLNLMKFYIEPDIKIFLNISPFEVMQRKVNETRELDKYESNFAFQDRVYGYYLEGCKEFKYNIVDADKSIEEIHNEIVRLIKN
jgi:dTMP kinase